MWEDVAAMLTPRAGLAVAALGGRLHALGGRQTDGKSQGVAAATLASTEVYNPYENEWTEGPLLPGSRCEASVVVL